MCYKVARVWNEVISEIAGNPKKKQDHIIEIKDGAMPKQVNIQGIK